MHKNASLETPARIAKQKQEKMKNLNPDVAY